MGDDVLVIHIATETMEALEAVAIASVTTTLRLEAVGSDTRIYLPEEAVRRLRSACDEWLAVGSEVSA